MSDSTPLLSIPQTPSSVDKVSNVKKLETPPSSIIEEEKSKQDSLKWLVLFLTLFVNFGSYYCYYTPQSLQTKIQQTFGIQNAEFNLLFSAEAIPNIILPFFSGLAVDMIGIRTTMIVSASIEVIGQFLVTFGAYSINFNIMLVGRFISGIGAEALESVPMVLIFRWFTAKELAFAWGILLSSLRWSSACNSFLSPRLYVWADNLHTPFFFGSLLTIVSLLSVFVILYVDKKVQIKANNTNAQMDESDSEKFHISDLKKLPRLFFLMMILGVLCSSSYLGFYTNANDFLSSRFGFDLENAGSLLIIIDLIPALCNPLVGLAIGRLGKRIFFLITAIAILFFSHLFFAFLPDSGPENVNYSVIIGFILFGLYTTIFSTTYWAAIPLIAPSNAIGTANGIVSGALNVGLTFYPILLGFIHDNSLDLHSGYYLTQIAQCATVVIAFWLAITIYFEDVRTGAQLYLNHHENKQEDLKKQEGKYLEMKEIASY